MVAYNFQKQFADNVRTGKKFCTIRAARKNGHAKPGDRLQLYTGMRTKDCQKLIDPDPLCFGIKPITLSLSAVGLQITVDDYVLTGSESNEVAITDGFADLASMQAWFQETHSLPFNGFLITWEPATHE